MAIPARYENGVFRLLDDVQIGEGAVVEVRVPADRPPTRKRPSIRELPFSGMWKDRADIGEGMEYVTGSGIIDTDVTLDVSRANENAAGYVASLIDTAISIITARELIVGARDKRDLCLA